MITENLSTLKINKLTQAQYNRELEAGRIDPNALYLTPDENVSLFIAEYGKTTYQEIFDAAVEDGKTVLCNYILNNNDMSSVFTLAYCHLDVIKFVGDTRYGKQEVICTMDNVWSINSIELPQADWNQNDETAPDFIKNRTHYTTQATLLPETTLAYNEEQGAFVIEKNIEFAEGGSYTVTWNGVEYIATTKMFSGAPYLGNEVVFEGTDSGEPFTIVCMEGMLMAVAIDGATELTMSISGEYVEKIPAKYLPSFNFVNGSAMGSVRHIYSAEENDEYQMGSNAFAEGVNTTASGDASHAEGTDTTASGNASHAEGNNTTASGSDSHAEGVNTTASGDTSHAEGINTTASGNYSHAEGNNTTASGNISHAEGNGTEASGNYSHAEGNGTIATGESSHVQGKYNIEDTNLELAHIVGNGGVVNSRSNAHTLDWDGNAWFAGDVYVGSTSGTNKDAGSKKLIAAPTANTGDLLMYDGTNWVALSKSDLIAEIIAALPNT